MPRFVKDWSYSDIDEESDSMPYPLPVTPEPATQARKCQHCWCDIPGGTTCYPCLDKIALRYAQITMPNKQENND